MFIERKPGVGNYPSISESGNVLSIGSHNIDLDNERKDSETLIDIKEGAAFLANVIIPPNTYTTVDTGEVDEDGNTVFASSLNPINKARVRVILWPKREFNDQEEI
jgi:hypothetical protein